MSQISRLHTAGCALAVSLLLAAAGSGCSSSSSRTTAKAAKPAATPAVATTAPAAAAATPTPPAPEKPVGPAAASLRNSGAFQSTPLSEAIKQLGPEGILYFQHIAYLSDPAMEGRSADVRGNKIAADYLEFHFKQLGLEPAFPVEVDGVAATPPAKTYQQPFKVRGDIAVNKAELGFEFRENPAEAVMPTKVEFKAGEDFNVLGCSGNGTVTGELAFCGYSIEDGPDGYTTFPKDADLKGKIALILRFEPVNAEGKSKWTSFGRWSQRAGLIEKIKLAISKGAAAVVLVNPPGVDDPRIEKLETAKSTRFGGVPVPVVMMTIPAANKIIAHADPDGRSLLKLRTLADESGGVVNLGKQAVKVTITTDVEQKQLPTQNVGAILPGKGLLASEYIVVGGHYDHVGYGYVGGANPNNVGKIHAGADDNASGASGVLLAAKILKDDYAKLSEGTAARSILFLGFSAEEMGLLGSDHFVKHPPFAASQITTMLNMDMIGRLTSNKLEIDGVGTAENFETFLKPMLDKAGFEYTLGQSGRGPSDHATFYGADIPVLHLFTGTHPDYHTPTDTIEKINVDGAVRTVDLLSDIAMALATRPEKMTFKPSAAAPAGRPRGGSSVRLGIAPGDYSGQQPGVLVGEVFEGTSAFNAGIKKGDRIIKWGGEELANVEAMMSRLATNKPGDKVDMVIVRDGKEMTVTVTMLGREPRG